MKKLVNAALLLALSASAAQAQINAGEKAPEASLPFTMTQVATFKLPWRIAFLPDGRMLVTEKVGPVWLVTQQGEKTPVDNVPAVLWQDRVACSVSIRRRTTQPTTASILLTPNRAIPARPVWRWRVRA